MGGELALHAPHGGWKLSVCGAEMSRPVPPTPPRQWSLGMDRRDTRGPRRKSTLSRLTNSLSVPPAHTRILQQEMGALPMVRGI